MREYVEAGKHVTISKCYVFVRLRSNSQPGIIGVAVSRSDITLGSPADSAFRQHDILGDNRKCSISAAGLNRTISFQPHERHARPGLQQPFILDAVVQQARQPVLAIGVSTLRSRRWC